MSRFSESLGRTRNDVCRGDIHVARAATHTYSLGSAPDGRGDIYVARPASLSSSHDSIIHGPVAAGFSPRLSPRVEIAQAEARGYGCGCGCGSSEALSARQELP